MSINKLSENKLFSLHLAVFLFGLAGLFGKLILLPAILIVLGRVFFASGLLFILLKLKHKASVGLSLKEARNYLFLGAFLAFHWFSFFHSIQLSSVAIGLLTFASFPLFTIFLEPWILKEKFEYSYLPSAAMVCLGLYLIIPDFNLDNLNTQGVIWGILSGVSFSFLTIVNRKLVKEENALKVTFFQDLFAFLFLAPALLFVDFHISWKDLFYLILLGSLFTALAHYLYINSLKGINARTASIVASLEPVYGIIFAFFLLGEIPGNNTLLGGLLILTAVLFINFKRR